MTIVNIQLYFDNPSSVSDSVRFYQSNMELPTDDWQCESLLWKE